MSTDKQELQRGDLWAMAKAEFLDITRPKPRLSVLALKYDLDLGRLMQAALNQRWEELRSKSETVALVTVTPETRAAVVKQVDTVILNGMRTVAESAFRTYATLMAQIEEMETENPDDSAATDDPEELPTPKKPKRSRKPTVGQKLAMVNNLTDGVARFANQIRELGWVCNPEVVAAGGDALSKALNITPTTLAPESAGIPPPLAEPPVQKALVNSTIPALPDSPPIPSGTTCAP